MAESPSSLSTPAPLTGAHDLSGFSSGEATLDDWLRERALANMEIAATRTYVVCPEGERRVVGYYALAMGQILNREATGAMRRNMPKQIPAVLLGRLAIDSGWQGRGVGRALLADAVRRSQAAASEVSARLIVVHAISAAAEAFYEHHGFTRLLVETPTFALDLVKLARLQGAADRF